MNNIKIIDNVLPFNEIFYKNCFYNSLFPVIRHYNKNVLPIFINDVIVYDNLNINSTLQFGIKYLSNKSKEEVLDELGIIIEQFNYRINLINDIRKAIQGSKPVIIWVDCFYESFRNDSYKKNHWMHTLLINGYNDGERTANIVEHKHRDNLSYENRTISYEDIENSYEGYYANFKSRSNLSSYFEFSLKEPKQTIYTDNAGLRICKKTFFSNVKKKEIDIVYGLEKLSGFSKEFEEIVLSEQILKNKVDILINSFNMIINAKQTEMYKISRLLGEQHQITKLQQEIVQYWIFIRSIVAKYKFSKIYKQENFVSLFDKLKKILELEHLYHERLRSLII